MYPRNAASPPRIAIGQVVLIADGTVQTSGVSVVVRAEGGSETAGGGTISYGASSNIVYYTPTQAETNYTAFVVVAYKASCFSVSQTVITTASATSGYAGIDWSKVTNPTSTVGLSGTTVGTTTTNTDMRGTDSAATATALATAQADLDILTGSDGVTLATSQPNYAPAVAGNSMALTAAAVDAIWDEQLTGATHNVTDSAGKRIRNVQEWGTYEGGSIFIDTINGSAGTTDYESGTILNPVNSIADANTLAASLNLARFAITPGSSITFAATQSTQIFNGAEYTIALGGQDISDTQIIGATVSGTATATSSPSFRDCTIGTANLPATIIENCLLNSTLTLGEAGNYDFINSHGEGLTGCIIDMGAAIGNSNLTFCNWSGVLELQNMGATGTDVAGVGGCGIITINANCTGGTLYLIGNFSVTDNSGGAVTIVYDDGYTNISSILTDTGTTIPATLGSPAGASVSADIAAVKSDSAAILTDTGTTLPATLAALNNISVADILTTQMTESYAADGVAPTLAQALFLIQQTIGDFTISGTTITVKKLNGSTTAATYTLDSSTAPTSRTRAS